MLHSFVSQNCKLISYQNKIIFFSYEMYMNMKGKYIEHLLYVHTFVILR